MADNVNVKLDDLSPEQLRSAIASLLQQQKQTDAAFNDLALKVANREAENSRLRAALGMVAEEQQNVASQEEASTEEE
tara:strand:+ start:316 stop:549 length:234 start_codon:yes stop_codon:yes gene_type:complete